jgi:hypothetical protein
VPDTLHRRDCPETAVDGSIFLHCDISYSITSSAPASSIGGTVRPNLIHKETSARGRGLRDVPQRAD